MPDEKKPAFKKIAATERCKKILADHFHELDAAAKSRSPKIAWCTSVGPVELLRAMGYLVYFPENHGALLGATRKAMDYIPVANAAGYSPEICSYLTSDIGAFIKGETPLAGAYEGITEVPRPDLLVYNTNQCREVKDWMMWYRRRLSVPCLGIETFCNVDQVTASHVTAIGTQLKNLIPVLEEVGGVKFDIDRLRHVIGLSRSCTDLWQQVLETARNRPSPLTFFDGTIHMGPAVIARGTPAAVEYYQILLAELQQRVADKVAAVAGEKYRLFWEGMPVWGKLRDLSTLFLAQRACVVASTYCHSWVFEALDPADPFASMARAYTNLFIVRSDQAKEQVLGEVVKNYCIDGMLFHDAKTCPNNSNNRHGMPARLAEKYGLPSVTINGDLNDLRLYSEEQSVTRIEAFIEQLQERRRP